MLLHFKDCLEYSRETLYENNYVKNNNTFVYEELKKNDSTYSKTRFNRNIYMERIINAIDNCKNFENDISKIKENVGTNIYYLFGKFM